MALTSSIPVVRASDYERSRAFYLLLGFTIAEEGGDPARFGIFKREAATIFVDSWHGPDAEPSPAWRAYFHTDDLATLVDDLAAVGMVHDGPVDTVYGMREIVVTDPDGNRLCFGQDLP